MRRTIRLTVLAAVLVFAWGVSLRADSTCESMHLKKCPFRGLESPCTFADGSPGLCTCVGRWDCGL